MRVWQVEGENNEKCMIKVLSDSSGLVWID